MLNQSARTMLMCATGGIKYYDQLWGRTLVHSSDVIDWTPFSDRFSPLSVLADRGEFHAHFSYLMKIWVGGWVGGPSPAQVRLVRIRGWVGGGGNVSNTSKFCMRAMQHCLRIAPNHAGLTIMDCNIKVNEPGYNRTSMVCTLILLR